VRRNELLCNARRKSLQWMAVAAIGLATSMTLQAGAEAREVGKKKTGTRTVYLAKHGVHGEVRYSKPGQGKTVRISAAEYRAGASLVCTPSGFGQRSRCYRPGIF
jgi:hypothetical protein